LSRVMKQKLLFYLDFWFTHFGIAKALTEKYDCIPYAIIDISEKPKKLFHNQQIVKFKNEWCVRDNVSRTTKKLDLEYLEKFERKYKINLWKIAFTTMNF